ncbi:MAG TPA: VTT domain-containing protein [Solirubrobacteraceae bacterium]|jgi:uncharacterized membrane protein YdjX (TVP38/TMEM64 family)
MRAAGLRLGALTIALVAAFVVIRFGGFDITLERVRTWCADAGWIAPVAFVPLAVALNSAFVPFPLLAGAAGAAFGIGEATAMGIVVAAAAAVVQMLIGRHLVGAGAFDGLDGVARVNDFVERRGLLAVLYTRLLPGLPFVPLNYASGLTNLRVRDMAVGTAIAKAPRAFAYAALGGSLSDLSAPEAQVAIALLVVFGVAGLVVARAELIAERKRDRQ